MLHILMKIRQKDSLSSNIDVIHFNHKLRSESDMEVMVVIAILQEIC
jgi:hypothetical protein